MNYPYGENFLYTDCHPVLALTLKKLSPYIPAINSHTVGILNSLLLLSFIATSFFLFLIFYELKVKYLLAILGAVAIMILSPQVLRLGGHYALSYACFIPITLYLLIKFEKKKSNFVWPILLLLNNLFWLFIHAYLGMIIISFTMLYLLFKLIYEFKNWRSNSLQYLSLIASIIVPIILFLSSLKLTDIHIGRTTNAGDLLEHSANLFTIFLPFKVHSFYPFFQNLFKDTFVHWEDIAYIGLLSDFILLAVLFSILFTWIKNKKIQFKHNWMDNKFLIIALPSSIVLLLFAMDLPFVLGMEGLLDFRAFEIIKNFRANGRFAWVFYFLITISIIYLINKWTDQLEKENRKIIAIFIIILYPTSLIFEGHYYHKHVSNRVSGHKNLFDINLVDPKLKEAIDFIEIDKYQAILPFPFFHTGSQNFEKTFRKNIFQLTLITSYHTAIPTMASQLTRVSIPESKSLMQVVSNGFYKKELEEILTDERPILIIRSKEPINKHEKEYLAKSKKIFDGGDFQFYEIERNELFKNTSEIELRKFNRLQEDLYFKDGFLVSDTTGYFLYNDFEELSSPYAYRGEGAFSGPKDISNVIISIAGEDLELNTVYIASIWVYNCGDNFGQDQLFGALALDARFEEDVEWVNPHRQPRFSQVIDACWTFVELPFKIKTKKAEYLLKLVRDPGSTKTMYVDDLLIYKKGTKIYKLEGQELFKNNHKIVLKD